jgi:DNA-binding beta-propeller fold protein YncE
MAAATTTDVTGNFSLTVPTGGMPFDGYLTMTMSGLIPARLYVWKPPTSDIEIGKVFLGSFDDLNSILGQLGGWTTTQGNVVVLLRGSAISEVQVEEIAVQQNGTGVGYLFDPSSLGISGVGIWAINVPPGPTEVAAQFGTTFGPAQITASQGQMTFALLIDDQQPTSLRHVDFTVGAQPTTLVFDGSSIWVFNQDSSVTKISSDGFIEGTFFIRGLPLAAASVGSGSSFAMWVASTDALDVPPYSSGGGAYLTQLDASGKILQTHTIPQQPIAFAVIQSDLGEPLLYFVDMNSDRLWSFDPVTGRETAVNYIGGAGSQALLFDGTHLWISNATTNKVIKVDVPSGVPIDSFATTGNMPGGLAFDGNSNSIWVANYSSNTVAKLDANDGHIQKVIVTGINPSWLAYDGVNVWVTNSGSNTLTQIRASDGVVLGNFATGSTPAGVVFDGANVWVANSGSNNVSEYLIQSVPS